MDCVNIMGLVAMKYSGNFLTWSNRQESRIACKHDKVLMNVDWMGRYANFEAEYINPGTTSDHSYMKVSLVAHIDRENNFQIF